MPLTQAELAEFRKCEAREAQKREARTGSLLVTHDTIDGCRVEIDYEAHGDDRKELKSDSLKKAVRMVREKGFQLPDLRFVLTAAEGCENVAFMGDGRGRRKYTVFL